MALHRSDTKLADNDFRQSDTVEEVGNGPRTDRDGQTRSAPRSALVVMLVASTVLMFFNSSGLKRWARDLPGNALTDRIVLIADIWHEQMDEVGLAEPKAMASDTVREFRKQDWSSLFGSTNAFAEVVAVGSGDPHDDR